MCPMDPGAFSKPGDSNPAEDWATFGDDLFQQGRFGESILVYERALEINPPDKVLWNSIGLALCHLGRNDEAIESFEKAINIDHEYLDAWNNKGVFSSGKKDMKKPWKFLMKSWR